MERIGKDLMVVMVSISLGVSLQGMSMTQRKTTEAQIRAKTAFESFRERRERIDAEIRQLKQQLARTLAEPKVTVVPSPPLPTPAPIEILPAPIPDITPEQTVTAPISVQPTTAAEPMKRPLPLAPEGQPVVGRPLSQIPTEPLVLTKPAVRPMTTERPLPTIPVTERPLPAVPATKPEGALPEFEALPVPTEEELEKAWIPSFPPKDAPSVPVSEAPSRPTLLEEIRAGRTLRPVTVTPQPQPIEQPKTTQQSLLEEIQRGKQLRPVPPAERREYRSDIYKLFEGEEAARGFERARQQALERAQAQAAQEEDWEGWE